MLCCQPLASLVTAFILSVASKLLGQGCFDVLPVFIILLPEITSPQAGIWEQLPDR